jgi:hypothetical protein
MKEHAARQRFFSARRNGKKRGDPIFSESTEGHRKKCSRGRLECGLPVVAADSA